MSISLNKGSSLNLAKESPRLKNIMIGVGWDPGQYIIDLDASAFMIGKNGKIPQDEFFVFYNNLKSPDGALTHTGDNRTGEGEGDDEKIVANLSLVDHKIEEILLIVSIHNADIREHHFGQLRNAFIRVYDLDNKKEILKFTLDETLDKSTEVEFGKLQRIDNEWKFTAIGNGTTKGLQAYVDIYA